MAAGYDKDGRLQAMSTLLIAVITALVTTVATSYLISPRLEARNRRIQEAHRARDQFSTNITIIMGRSMRLQALPVPPEAHLDVVKALDGERERWISGLNEATRQLIDDVEQFAGTYLPWMRLQELAVHFAISARLVWVSRRPLNKKVELLSELATHAHAIYFAPWYQKWSLPQHVSDLRQLLDDLADERR